MSNGKGGLGLLALAGIVGVGFLLTRKPQPQPGMANLNGIVTDSQTSQPIDSVLVAVDGNSDLSDGSGYFELFNLIPGTYSITFSKDGYETLVV